MAWFIRTLAPVPFVMAPVVPPPPADSSCVELFFGGADERSPAQTVPMFLLDLMTIGGASYPNPCARVEAEMQAISDAQSALFQGKL